MPTKKWILVFVPLTLVILLFTLGGRDTSPPDISDLSLQPLTAGKEANACNFFREAADRLYCPVDKWVLHEILAGATNAPQLVTMLIASNQQAFAQLDCGLNCRICILPEPRADSDLPAEQCRDWTTMGCILALQAQRELDLGHLQAASATCKRLIRFGSLVQQEPQTLLQFLIGQTILGQGFWQIRVLANHPETTSSQLQEFVQQLDALVPPAKNLTRPVLTEFRRSASLLNQLKANPETFLGNTGGASATLFASRLFSSPYFFKLNETMGRLAVQHRELLANLSLPYATIRNHPRPAYPETKLGRLVWWTRPNALGRLLLSFSFDPIMLGETQSDVTCAFYGTRLVLACRTYQLKHGERPSSLAVLVPDHLADIPADPFDGAPFRYSREKAVVYAVGKDLYDDGGGDGDGSVRGSCDIVFPLDEKTRPAD